MNAKRVGVVLVLLIAAAVIARWRYHAYQSEHPSNPLGVRLTFDYQGPVPGLFDLLSARSGAHYKVNPALAERTVSGSFKNKSVVQVQAEAAKAAGLRYSPPTAGSRAIRVDPK